MAQEPFWLKPFWLKSRAWLRVRLAAMPRPTKRARVAKNSDPVVNWLAGAVRILQRQYRQVAEGLPKAPVTVSQKQHVPGDLRAGAPAFVSQVELLLSALGTESTARAQFAL